MCPSTSGTLRVIGDATSSFIEQVIPKPQSEIRAAVYMQDFGMDLQAIFG